MKSKRPGPKGPKGPNDKAGGRGGRGGRGKADKGPRGAGSDKGGKSPRAFKGPRPDQGDKRMLPRLLSRWNVASRKQAEQLVHDGRVAVGGRVVRNVLALVDERARVTVDGELVGPAPELAWIALNKPRGVVTTTHDPDGRRTVLDLVGAKLRGLSPVGRLDLDSAGLLLLTNDHALAAALLDPATHVTKTYRVKVQGHVEDAVLERLRRDTLEVDGLVLGPIGATVSAYGPNSTWLDVTLAEGKNRQVRRQLAHHGHEVMVLIRTGFGPIALGDLEAGASRRLTSAEMTRLRSAVQGSAGGRRSRDRT